MGEPEGGKVVAAGLAETAAEGISTTCTAGSRSAAERKTGMEFSGHTGASPCIELVTLQ